FKWPVLSLEGWGWDPKSPRRQFNGTTYVSSPPHAWRLANASHPQVGVSPAGPAYWTSACFTGNEAVGCGL
ncbi:hypothetical protein Csa_023655, partial [Cucumis sativus]